PETNHSRSIPFSFIEATSASADCCAGIRYSRPSCAPVLTWWTCVAIAVTPRAGADGSCRRTPDAPDVPAPHASLTSIPSVAGRTKIAPLSAAVKHRLTTGSYSRYGPAPSDDQRDIMRSGSHATARSGGTVRQTDVAQLMLEREVASFLYHEAELLDER